MDFNICTSLVGKGLEREYLLLRDLLMSHGHYVVGYHYTNINASFVRADVNIFMEVVLPPLLNLSRENWFLPNSEWFHSINEQYIPRFTKILCKTRDCYDIWSRKVGAEKCVYTGFESRDLYRPDITKEVKFLHVAGESEFKNTEAVIRAWRTTDGRNLPPLTVVTRHKKFWDLCEDAPGKNITCIRERISDEQVIELMNSHMFHVMPSMYEGFGHALHEAVGVGAMVLTTDAPPMRDVNGIMRECLIPVVKRTPRCLATLNEVSPQGVIDAVRRALNIKASDQQWDCFGHKVPDEKRPWLNRAPLARQAFLNDRDYFRKTFMGLVDDFISRQFVQNGPNTL